MWRFIQASGERDPQGGGKEEEGEGEGGVKDVVCEIPGHGMFWEADECARCLRDVSGDFFFLSLSLSPSLLLYGFAHMYPPIFSSFFPPPVSEEKKKKKKKEGK